MEGFLRRWRQHDELLGQARRQPTQPFDIARSARPAVQNDVPRDQAVARRDDEGDRLGGTGVLRPVAPGAHSSRIGRKYQPELAAGDVCPRGLVRRQCDVRQPGQEDDPSAAHVSERKGPRLGKAV